jgi:hypothetical protein
MDGHVVSSFSAIHAYMHVCANPNVSATSEITCMKSRNQDIVLVLSRRPGLDPHGDTMDIFFALY